VSNNNSQLATPEQLGQGAYSHPAINSSQNDLHLDGRYNIHRLDPASAINLTGFSGGRPGRTVILRNVGDETITILHLSELSLLQNRVNCPGGTGYSLAVGESVSMVCDDLQTGSGQWALGV
jgi:hypothetical protein